MVTAKSMAIKLVAQNTLMDKIKEDTEDMIREVKEQIEDPAEQMLIVGLFVVNMDTARGLVINQEIKGFLIEDRRRLIFFFQYFMRSVATCKIIFFKFKM